MQTFLRARFGLEAQIGSSYQPFVAMVRYCPFAAHAKLLSLLAIASNYHCAPGQLAAVVKSGTPLNLSRALGLGLEQALTSLVATGSPRGSVPYVVFSKVVSNNASPEGTIGIPLSKLQQEFLYSLSERVWAYFQYLGLSVLGIDVPYKHFEESAPADKAYDIVGVSMQGSLLPILGRSAVELFVTHGDWGGDAIRQKKDKTAAAIALASAMFLCHFLLVVRIEGDDLPQVVGHKLFQHVNSDWTELSFELELMEIPLRLTVTEQAFKDIMAQMGPPLETRTRYAAPMYSLRKFLNKCECKDDTYRVIKVLKPKGVVGFKKRKLAHGSGGSRDGKINSVWSGNREQLRAAFRHICQGSIQ